MNPTLPLIKRLAPATVALFIAAVMTGCANHRPATSEVVVAPMGMPNGSAYYNGNGNYNGGAVVSNNVAIVDAANANPKAVYFGFDSSAVDAQGEAVLNQHAAFLKDHPDARVQISGHTDERGSREYNMALGERRAKAAQSYLASQGIATSRTEAISFGEDQPAATGHDEASWQLNRRAELSY